MKKQWVALFAIAVIGSAWAALYFGVIQGSDSHSDTSQSSEVAEASNTDNPLSLDITSLEGQYIATITGVSSTGQAGTSTISSDGMGNIWSQILFQDGLAETILVGDQIFTKVADGPYQLLPLSPEEFSESGGSFGINTDDIAEIDESTVRPFGQADCGDGLRCNVFKEENAETGDDNEYYIDIATNRLVEVRLVNEVQSTDATVRFDYDTPVEISAPAEFETIDIEASL